MGKLWTTILTVLLLALIILTLIRPFSIQFHRLAGISAYLIPLFFIHLGLLLLKDKSSAIIAKTAVLWLLWMFSLPVIAGGYEVIKLLPAKYCTPWGSKLLNWLSQFLGPAGSAIFFLGSLLIITLASLNRRPLIQGKTYLVILVVFLGMTYRIAGVGWGNGWGHIDEVYYFLRSDAFLQGKFQPTRYEHPYAFIWLMYFADLTYKFFYNFPPDHTNQTMIGRFVNGILGTFTLLMVYLLGKIMYGWKNGLLAAFLLAINPLHFMNSHYIAFDVPVVFFMTLSALFCYKVITSGRLYWYILAGFCSGLAFGAKYTGLFMVFPLFISHLLHHKRKVGEASYLELKVKHVLKTLIDPKLYLLYLLMLVGFLLPNYFILKDFNTFWADFNQAIRLARYEKFMQFTDLPIGYIFHIKENLRNAFGPPVLIAALLGVIGCLIRRWDSDVLLLFMIFPFYLNIGRFMGKYTRYMMPVIPVLCLMAAIMLSGELIGFKLLKKFKLKPVSYIVIASISLYALIYGTAYLNILLQKDTRMLANEWIERNVPPHTKFGLMVSPVGLIIHDKPPIDHQKYNVIRSTHMSEFLEMDLDYFTFSIFDYDQIFRLEHHKGDPEFAHVSQWLDQAWAYHDLLDGKTKYVLEKKYERKPILFGINFDRPNAIHDWFYTFPTVYIYKNKKLLGR